MLDGGEVQEILAEVVLGDLVRRLVKVRGELPDGVDVGLLSPRREAAELHVFQHALTEWRHGVSFPGGAFDRRGENAP